MSRCFTVVHTTTPSGAAPCKKDAALAVCSPLVSTFPSRESDSKRMEWLFQQQQERRRCAFNLHHCVRALVAEAARRDEQKYQELLDLLRQVVGAYRSTSMDVSASPGPMEAGAFHATRCRDHWKVFAQEVAVATINDVMDCTEAGDVESMEHILGVVGRQIMWNGCVSLQLAQRVLQHCRVACLNARTTAASGVVDVPPVLLQLMTNVAVSIPVLETAVAESGSLKPSARVEGAQTVRRVDFINSPITAAHLLLRKLLCGQQQNSARMIPLINSLARLLTPMTPSSIPMPPRLDAEPKTPTVAIKAVAY